MMLAFIIILKVSWILSYPIILSYIWRAQIAVLFWSTHCDTFLIHFGATASLFPTLDSVPVIYLRGGGNSWGLRALFLAWHFGGNSYLKWEDKWAFTLDNAVFQSHSRSRAWGQNPQQGHSWVNMGEHKHTVIWEGTYDEKTWRSSRHWAKANTYRFIHQRDGWQSFKPYNP